VYDLAELLEGMRGVCFRALQGAFDDFRKNEQRFFAEPAMQAADRNVLAREGPLSLPFRCDALVVSPDGKEVTPHIFNVERRWNFSPVEFEYGGLLIALSSCHWENVKVAISGDAQTVAGGVKAWFEAAFIPVEQLAEDAIQNVVHDLSGFQAKDGVTTFLLDCGTMPVDQMFALFDHLRGAGATRVELSMP
jgi:hypothetical protein